MKPKIRRLEPLLQNPLRHRNNPRLYRAAQGHDRRAPRSAPAVERQAAIEAGAGSAAVAQGRRPRQYAVTRALPR
jgi:hypothetical protein